MGKSHIRTILSWSAVLIWMGVIFFLSHQPGSQPSDLSSGITDVIVHTLQHIVPFLPMEDVFFHHFIRKSAHFTAYCILGILVIHALSEPNWRRYMTAFLIAVVYAMTDEFHQLFIPGRSGELRDVAIDSVGAATGIGIYMLSMFIISRFRKGKE